MIPNLNTNIESIMLGGLIIPVKTNLLAHVTTFENGKAKNLLVDVNESDQVTDWFPTSGTVFNADQATLNRQPIYTQSAINGYPALNFNGSTNLLNFGPIFDPSAKNFTIFAVVQLNSNAAVKTIISQVAINESLLDTDDDSDWRSTIGAGNTLGGSFTTNPTILTLKKYENQFDGTDLTVYINGVAGTPRTVTPNSNTADWIIGSRNTSGGSPVDGFIGEIAIYDRDLADSEQKQVEADYLSPKWGIALV